MSTPTIKYSKDKKKEYAGRVIGGALTFLIKKFGIPEELANSIGDEFGSFVAGVEVSDNQTDTVEKHWGQALDRTWIRMRKNRDLPNEFWEPLEEVLFMTTDTAELFFKTYTNNQESDNDGLDIYTQLDAIINDIHKDSEIIDVGTIPEGFSKDLVDLLKQEIKNDIALLGVVLYLADRVNREKVFSLKSDSNAQQLSLTTKKHFTNKNLIAPFTREDADGTQGGTYVPRDDLLGKIADCLNKQVGQKRMVFLSGMGGCGKSELARAYADQHRDEYDDIFWLVCTDGIIPNLMTIMESAKKLCDVTAGDVAGFTNRVLIIVDNCNTEDGGFLTELSRETGDADIMVTTRLTYIGSYYTRTILVESSDPRTFAYSVFEKNYCKQSRWEKGKEITEDEKEYVYTICREIQYNTMIVSMIGIRLREYSNLSLKECAGKIQNGVSTIKGKIDIQKDLISHSDGIKEIMSFLFSDILNYSYSDTQKEILTVLSLTPASWYERNYLLSLLEGTNQDTDYQHDSKELLNHGWLQGDKDMIAIHPLIAEIMADQPVLILNPSFFGRLVDNYLGMEKKYLDKGKTLINRILGISDASFEKKTTAMLLLNHGDYKNAFLKLHPEINSALFVHICILGKRFFLYHDLENNKTGTLTFVSSKCGESDYVNLLRIYNNGIPYTIDFQVMFFKKAIKTIPEGFCYHDKLLVQVNLNGVTSIGKNAFTGCSNLREFSLLHGCSGLTRNLYLPDSVRTIGAGAFSGCSGLSGELHLPDSIITIGDSSFDGCSGLTGNLYLPDSVRAIGAGAFSGCSGLSGELHLPDGITTIKDSSFDGCSGLTGNLYLPDSVRTIGADAFSGCSGLSGELHLPDGITTIGDSSFYGCSGLSGDLTLPDSVRTIGAGAFSGCSGLSGKLHLPHSLRMIGDGAFLECTGLKGKLYFPDGLTTIGISAFFGCSGLSGGLDFPDSLITIGDGAFVGCSGLSGDLVLPNSKTKIGENALAGCQNPRLKQRFQDNLKPMRNSGFSDYINMNGGLYFLGNLTMIEDNAFYGRSDLKGVLYLPDGLISIGDGAFCNCSGLSGELHFPDGLATIGRMAFLGCSGLSGNLHLPDGLTTIESMAFFQCSGLNGNLHLPDGLTTIGRMAFSGCSGLNGDLHFPDGLTTIDAYAFSHCRGLNGELHFPDSLTTIGFSAFSVCSGLSGNLYLPDGLTTIESMAFFQCSGLSGNLHLPDGLTTIGFSAFSHCSGLRGKLHLPDSLTTIGRMAFSHCSGLNGELHLPDGLTEINTGIFEGCSGLNGILHLPDSLKSIGNIAFSNCSGLSGELRLPDSLEFIGREAFSGCKGLSGELRLPHGLKSIEDEAFSGCSGLRGELMLPDSLESTGVKAFDGCVGIGKIIVCNPNMMISHPIFTYSSIIICGYRHSTAEKYAHENGFNFEEIKKC